MKKIYSIIIPTYNCWQLLEKTLKSIVSQDENLYECIIVDGKSTDKTLEVIYKYKEMHSSNIKFISEPDKGIYDAMNKGIDLAQGEYLYFIGAGDTLTDDCLIKLKKYLNFNLEMVFGNVFLESQKILIGSQYNKKDLSISFFCHQQIFYNRMIFKVIGKYRLKYKVFADAEFNIRCFGNDKIIKKYVDIEIANYMEDGFSDNNIDSNYINDYECIIKSNLGSSYYEDYYIKSYRQFYDVLKHLDEKIVLFGSFSNLKSICEHIASLNLLYKIKDIYTYEDKYVGSVLKSHTIRNFKTLLNTNTDIIAMLPNEKEFLHQHSNIIEISYFIISSRFIDFLKVCDSKKVVIFGASKLAKNTIDFLKNLNKNITVEYILDNDLSKHGKIIYDKVVYNPDKINLDKRLEVLVASSWFTEIKKQLLQYGFKEENIIKVMG